MKNLNLKLVLLALFSILIGVIVIQKKQLEHSEMWRYRWWGNALIDRDGDMFIIVNPVHGADGTLLYINHTVNIQEKTVKADTTYYQIISKEAYQQSALTGR